MWIGSSASRADYTSLPTVEQVTKDIGYRPVLIDAFENGYCFKKGNIMKNSFKDDNASVIEKFKSVSFDYQKNGDVVSFEQQKFNSKLISPGDIIATVNGTNLYYVHYINKVVSDDYELTEQDKKDQASGKVVFSYDDSASQIEVSQVQSVNWNKDDIQYDLLQIDGKLSAGELADMAKEVINNRRYRKKGLSLSRQLLWYIYDIKLNDIGYSKRGIVITSPPFIADSCAQIPVPVQ